MNKTISITGIPGIGKTTVCNAVEKLAKQAGEKVDVINYGTVMVKIFQKHKKEEAAKDVLKALGQV